MSENVKPGQSSLRPDPEKRHPTGPQPPQQTKPTDTHQRIQEFIDDLINIYDVIEATKLPFLEPADYRSLSIDCQELRLNRDGSYASPRPQPCFFNASYPNVDNHPVEFKNKGEDSWYFYESTEEMLNSCTGEPSKGYSSTDILSNILEWEFCEYPRKGLEEDLASHSGWRQSGDFQRDAVFDRVFWDELFFPSKIHYSPTIAFVPDSKNQPHLMFCMGHNIREDDRLLRGEALSIIAGIITRLKRFASAGHLYPPVLVFSFLGLLQGRILQAHYDGTNVVIRKSKIYGFSLENFRDMFSLFVQQMSSTPMGHTKGLIEADSRKTWDSSWDFSLRQRPSNIR